MHTFDPFLDSHGVRALCIDVPFFYCFVSGAFLLVPVTI
uniref:Uncharacterized protein n=1 Tax=Rhizophora mucronata TaxID=61149 RepID=A0A2P2QF92_RHIMU